MPNGRTAIKFAEVREWLQYGTSVHCDSEQRAFPVLRIPNIEAGRVNTTDLKYCDMSETEARKYLLEKGDLLFIRTNGVLDRLGACAVYDGDPQPALFASYLIRARLVDGIDPRYVAYFYASQEGASLIASRATPAADGKFNLNTGTIDSLPITLPSTLKEQRSIAAVLDRVRKAIDLQAECSAVAIELKGKLMSELFTRGLRGEPPKESEFGPIPESWTVEPLRAHHSVVSGGTPSRGNPAYWAGGSIPWVKTAEVNYCVIDRTDEHITRAGLAESAAKLLPAGTLLLAMYGQGVTRGKVAILGIDAACNQACAAIRAIDDRIDAKYLYHYLVSRYSAIRQLAHGGQQQNLNLDIVRDMQVVFPTDKAEQNEIVAILDALDRKIDVHQRKRAVLDDLFQALLDRLMTGEIAVDDLDLSALDRAAVTAKEATA